MGELVISLVGVTLVLSLVVGVPVALAEGLLRFQAWRVTRDRRAALRRARFTRWTRTGGVA